MEGSSRCRFVESDIADRELLRRLFAEEALDAIVNFAAESHVDRSTENPGELVQTNVVGAFFPPATALIALAKALHITADELLGLRVPKRAAAAAEDSEARRLWKKFRQVEDLPERDQRAVIRLINSLAQASSTSQQRNAAAR